MGPLRDNDNVERRDHTLYLSGYLILRYIADITKHNITAVSPVLYNKAIYLVVVAARKHKTAG
jgi:hypothetical protein